MQKITRRNLLRTMILTGAGSVLAACSSSAAGMQTSGETAAAQAGQPEAQPTSPAAAVAPLGDPAAAPAAGAGLPAGAPPPEGEPASAQEGLALVLGTLMMLDQGGSITQDQAAGLVPLWQEYLALNETMRPDPGQDPAQGEALPTPGGEGQTGFDDLFTRIQAAMTAEQLQAIEDMQITQESAASIIEELGLSLDLPEGGKGAPPEGQQPPQDAPAGGQPPAQGTPPAGGEMGGGRDPGGRGGMMLQPGLVEALIEALQQVGA